MCIKFWMKNLTMEKFVLEIPNFLPTNVCTSMIEKFEGSFTYPIGESTRYAEKE